MPAPAGLGIGTGGAAGSSFDPATLGMQAAGDLINTGMGLLLEKHNDNRQYNQQKRLQDLQIQGQEDLTNYSYQKQLDMWNATNYPAQVDQLIKAGLNPALLYGSHGGGGVTTGTGGATNVSGAEAPKGGMEIMELKNQTLQQEMMQAQIEATKSQATLNNAQAAKTSGADTTLTQTQTASLAQGISNQQSQQKLTEAQTKMQELQNTITGDTLENVIAQVNTQTSIIYDQLQSAQAQGDFDQSTLNDRINQVHTMAIGAILNNDLTKAKTSEAQSNIEVNSAQIQKMSADISQAWDRLTNVEERNADTNRMQQNLQEYIHNMPDSWKVSEEAISGILKVVTGNIQTGAQIPTRNPIGFKK